MIQLEYGAQDTVFSWLSKIQVLIMSDLARYWRLWMRQEANQIVEFGLNILVWGEIGNEWRLITNFDICAHHNNHFQSQYGDSTCRR